MENLIKSSAEWSNKYLWYVFLFFKPLDMFDLFYAEILL